MRKKEEERFWPLEGISVEAQDDAVHLARCIEEIHKQPADLLSPQTKELVEGLFSQARCLILEATRILERSY